MIRKPLLLASVPLELEVLAALIGVMSPKLVLAPSVSNATLQACIAAASALIPLSLPPLPQPPSAKSINAVNEAEGRLRLIVGRDRLPSVGRGHRRHCRRPPCQLGRHAGRLDPDASIRMKRPLALDDPLDPLGGRLDLAVTVLHDVVVVLLPAELDGRIALAQLELVGGLGGPRLETLEETLERGRHDEQENRIGDVLLDLLGTLHVDLEDDVEAPQQGFADL